MSRRGRGRGGRGSGAKPPRPQINYAAEDQAFLTLYLQEIARWAKASGHNKVYNNFLRANVLDAEDNPYFINALFNQKKTNRFNNANPALLSALVPKIRIYKVIELPDAPTPEEISQRGLDFLRTDQPKRKTYSFLLPFENYLATQFFGKEIFDNVEMLSKEFGKSYGTGIESIIVSDGSAIPDTSNITVNIKVKASNFDSLFLDHIVSSEEDPYVQTNVKLLDLFHRDKNPIPGSTEIIEDLYRLKVVIGWSYDLKMLQRINFGSSDLTASDISDLKAALERCFATYYCVYTTFNINIEEDGRIGLDIKYVGNNSMLGSRDVNVMYSNDGDGFAVTEEGLLEAIDKREQSKARLEQLRAHKPQDEKANEEFEKLLTAELDKIKREEEEDRYYIQKRFLEHIANESKVYQMKILNTSLAKMRGGLSPNAPDSKRRARAFTLYVQKSGNPPIISSVSKAMFDAQKKEIVGYSKSAKKYKKEDAEKVSSKIETKPTTISGKYRVINFIFLGDILEYAFGSLNVKKSIEFRNIIPIVGNFSIIDPQNPKSITDKEEDDLTTYEVLANRAQVFNYCDLPISVQRYKKFLFDNVIMKEAQKITLNTFLTKLFEECVNTTMDAGIFGENIRRIFGNAMFGESNLRTVTEDGTQKEFFSKRDIKDVWTRKKREAGAGGFEEFDVKLDLNPPLFDQERYAKNHIVNYFYIYSKVLDRIAGKILSYDDRNNFGIIDVHIGRDRGLVKKINFQKNNIKGLAESAYKSERERGGSNRPNPFYLQGVMNADIEMYGNPFFKAGSQVYLDPSFMLRSPGDLSKNLSDFGMGGYYQVTKVTHEISAEKFTSKVTAVFNHFGNGKIVKNDPTAENSEKPYSLDQLKDAIKKEGAKRADETKDLIPETEKDAAPTTGKAAKRRPRESRRDGKGSKSRSSGRDRGGTKRARSR